VHNTSVITDLLKKAGLDHLDDQISNDALSTGEKQLICIVRAILRKNKIIILDEATANIDIITEKKISTLLSETFSSATVLTIAHRM